MSASDSEPRSQSEATSEDESGDDEDATSAIGSSESEEEDSAEEEEEVLEPKVLPQRGTRGNRMNTLIADEDSADEEFWQQDFFAEENKDEEYEKSSEAEDEADTDFSESESESDEEAEEQKEPVRTSRHKPLKPPGAKKPATRVKQPLSAEAKALQAELKAERLAQQALPGEAPTLRHSTRVRVEEAQQVRQRAEKVKPKRIRPQVEYRPLSQDELLAEAARTELDNLRDLEQMVALEEATKKKALYKRSKYSGPMTRFHSKRVDDTALTMVEVVNMLPPPHMLPMKAPKPPAKLICAITGQPARYRDPVSGYGYADLAAYKALKQRLQNERRGATGKRNKRHHHQPASAQQAPSDANAVAETAGAAAQTVQTRDQQQQPQQQQQQQQQPALVLGTKSATDVLPATTSGVEALAAPVDLAGAASSTANFNAQTLTAQPQHDTPATSAAELTSSGAGAASVAAATPAALANSMYTGPEAALPHHDAHSTAEIANVHAETPTAQPMPSHIHHGSPIPVVSASAAGQPQQAASNAAGNPTPGLDNHSPQGKSAPTASNALPAQADGVQPMEM